MSSLYCSVSKPITASVVNPLSALLAENYGNNTISGTEVVMEKDGTPEPMCNWPHQESPAPPV